MADDTPRAILDSRDVWDAINALKAMQHMQNVKLAELTAIAGERQVNMATDISEIKTKLNTVQCIVHSTRLAIMERVMWAFGVGLVGLLAKFFYDFMSGKIK